MLLRVEQLQSGGLGSKHSKEALLRLTEALRAETFDLERALERVAKEQAKKPDAPLVQWKATDNDVHHPPGGYNSFLERGELGDAAHALHEAESTRAAEDRGFDRSLALLESALPHIH